MRQNRLKSLFFDEKIVVFSFFSMTFAVNLLYLQHIFKYVRVWKLKI